MHLRNVTVRRFGKELFEARDLSPEACQEFVDRFPESDGFELCFWITRESRTNVDFAGCGPRWSEKEQCYEPSPGEEISYFCSSLIRIAKQKNKPVKGMFNGTPIEISPQDIDVSDAVGRWMRP